MPRRKSQVNPYAPRWVPDWEQQTHAGNGSALVDDSEEPTPEPLVLNARDAAYVLGVSPRTLWAWTKAGLVPCVRIGSGKRVTTRYPVAELREWLSRGAKQQAAACEGVAE